MIKKAKQDYPNKKWIIADALTYKPEIKYDIIFSNAAKRKKPRLLICALCRKVLTCI
jgi:trans-aconitate methyltransferase